MTINSKLARLAVSASFLGAGLVAALPAYPADGNIVKANLSGKWQIALTGFTGCGNHALLMTVNLDNTASGATGTLVGHGGCGDSTLSNQSFTVNQLGVNGSGTANMSCGDGCGWNFKIQVAPDRSTFNLVDVTDPGNYLVGTAVRQ
jgi:hypothetical protein